LYGHVLSMVGDFAASFLPVKTRWHNSTLKRSSGVNTDDTDHANLKANDKD